MAQEEIQVQYNGQVYTLRVPQGTPDSEIQSYLQRNVGQQQPPRETSALGAVNAFATNLSNSLLFGAPEYLNRAINPDAAAYYDQMRQDYPKASTAGDIFGLVNPTRMGIKAGGKVVETIGRKVAPEAVETAGQKALQDAALKNAQSYTEAARRFDEAQALARIRPTPENIRAAEEAQRSINMIAKDLASIEKTAEKTTAKSMVRRGFDIAIPATGGIMGLQAGAGALGGARSNDYSSGFQQGSQTAGQMVQQYGLPFIPGMPQITQGITSLVPAGGVIAGETYNRMFPPQPTAPVAPTSFDMDRRIREEAYRRAIGQQ